MKLSNNHKHIHTYIYIIDKYQNNQTYIYINTQNTYYIHCTSELVARKATPQWLRNFAVSLPTGPSRLHLSAQLQKALLILPAVHGSPRPKNIHWSTIIHCFAEDHLIQKCCNYLRWFPCRNGGMTWKNPNQSGHRQAWSCGSGGRNLPKGPWFLMKVQHFAGQSKDLGTPDDDLTRRIQKVLWLNIIHFAIQHEDFELLTPGYQKQHPKGTSTSQRLHSWPIGPRTNSFRHFDFTAIIWVVKKWCPDWKVNQWSGV
jgi:hypothetical protein